MNTQQSCNWAFLTPELYLKEAIVLDDFYQVTVYFCLCLQCEGFERKPIDPETMETFVRLLTVAHYYAARAAAKAQKTLVSLKITYEMLLLTWTSVLLPVNKEGSSQPRQIPPTSFPSSFSLRYFLNFLSNFFHLLPIVSRTLLSGDQIYYSSSTEACQDHERLNSFTPFPSFTASSTNSIPQLIIHP